MVALSVFVLFTLKKNGLFIFAPNDKNVIDLVNIIAPEHLELNIKNPRKYLDKILLEGSKKADKIASEKVKKIQELVGF